MLIWDNQSSIFFLPMQRMVVSISSDKAVWDAVMSNKTVQELKKTFLEGIF